VIRGFRVSGLVLTDDDTSVAVRYHALAGRPVRGDKDPSPTARPGDRLLKNATHPFDPDLPDDACKCYARLQIFKLPFPRI